MADYIKRSDLFVLARCYIRLDEDWALEEAVPVKAIRNIPSTDVVEVVRCKNCVFCEYHPKFNFKYCKKSNWDSVHDDFYCACGVQR